jgi:hypothetical protein
MITSSRDITQTNSKHAILLDVAYSKFENGGVLERFEV